MYINVYIHVEWVTRHPSSISKTASPLKICTYIYIYLHVYKDEYRYACVYVYTYIYKYIYKYA